MKFSLVFYADLSPLLDEGSIPQSIMTMLLEEYLPYRFNFYN